MANYFRDLASDIIPFRMEAERLRESLSIDVTIVDGVIRWNSNDSVPPMDIVQFAVDLGFPVDFEKCQLARDHDISAFVSEYKKNQCVPSSEDLFEMTSAFGSGAVVVDVVSGRRIRL